MLTAAIVAAISFFFFLVLKSLALLPLLSPGSPVGPGDGSSYQVWTSLRSRSARDFTCS
jgi:hypothetical protein